MSPGHRTSGPTTSVASHPDSRQARPSPGGEPVAARAPAQFRPDIEGLRGIAILLVVAYHAGIRGFAGGYVGVDVFFVLSGYLITGLLVQEVERSGTIDLAAFYARRARRLLPALAVLLLFTSVAAFALYAPFEQRLIARTALSTAAYASNLLFARDSTEYMATASHGNPLLHTWSLSVEEQFYLGWPILVMLAMRVAAGTPTGRSRRRLLVVMAATAVVSCALSIWLTRIRQPWAFFLSPTRAWEFALGGLGMLLPMTTLGGRWAATFRCVASWLGLGGVVAAAIVFDPSTVFPGAAALLPAAATVMVLMAGISVGQASDAAARFGAGTLLKARPFQEMGRLSYSWYLWHWPLIAFAGAVWTTGSHGAKLVALVASLVLAEASFRLVEDPVRRHRALTARPGRSLLMAGALTIAGLGIAATWMYASASLAQTRSQARFTNAKSDVPLRDYSDCMAGYFNVKPKECVFGDRASPDTIVLFGDSHAASWFPAVERVADQKGWRLATFLKAACPPADVSFVVPALQREYSECATWRAAAINRIIELRPRAVILTSSFAYAVRLEAWREGLDRTFAAFDAAGVRVLHLRDTPRPRFDVPACLGRAAWRGGWIPSAPCIFDKLASLDEGIYRVERQDAGRYRGVTSVDLTEHICPGSKCEGEAGPIVIYSDSNHLTASFAASLAPILGRRLDQALAAVR